MKNTSTVLPPSNFFTKIFFQVTGTAKIVGLQSPVNNASTSDSSDKAIVLKVADAQRIYKVSGPVDCMCAD